MGSFLALSLFAFMVYCSTRLLSSRNQYWNGPAPSPEERRKNLQFIYSYIEQYPGSPIALEYPELTKMVIVSKMYEELNEMKRRGLISDADYEIELSKILPLVDIREDVANSKITS